MPRSGDHEQSLITMVLHPVDDVARSLPRRLAVPTT